MKLRPDWMLRDPFLSFVLPLSARQINLRQQINAVGRAFVIAVKGLSGGMQQMDQ